MGEERLPKRIRLEHLQQMWQMQMSNIWHICHTKHKKRGLSDVSNPKNYTTRLQYCLKYETIRTNVANFFIVFYSLLSPLSSFFFFSLLSHRFPLSSPCIISVLVSQDLRPVQDVYWQRRQRALSARAWRTASWKCAKSEWFVCETHRVPLSYLCSSHWFLSISLTL